MVIRGNQEINGTTGGEKHKRSTAIVSIWYQTAHEQPANKLENEEEA